MAKFPPLPSSPQWSSPPQPERPAGPGALRPTSGVAVALIIVMWIVWLGVTVVADLFGFLMFAFADAPGAGRAAQLMVVPAFAWFAFTFVAGAVLLYLRRRWWSIAAAFILAISPPFMIFAGYNLLDGAGGSGGHIQGSAGGPTTGPAPAVRMPPGGFAPPPMKVREQPDFRKANPAAATTQPAPTSR